MDEPYHPINCEFHDELELRALRRRPVTVLHRADDDALVQVTGVIAALGAQAGVEYLTLDGIDPIRLDRIESIDGVRPADFGG